MTFRPLKNTVLVKPADPPKVRPSGLIVPDNLKQRESCLSGEVIEIGELRDDKGNARTSDFKKGDIIYYNKYAGTPLKLNEQDFLVMKEGDILAKGIEDE